MMNKNKKGTSSKSPNKSGFIYIPPEVLTLIFASLPVKTLVRFRCVCKIWCSIIDSRDFVNMHLKLCNINNNKMLLLIREGLGCRGNDGFLLTVREADTLKKTAHILKSSQARYHLFGSCNGLLLMKFIRQFVSDPLKFSLWNPSIRKSLLLPPCPITPLLQCVLIHELGFAPSSKDYKVVVIAIDKGRHAFEPTLPYVAVYTLSNQQWTVRHSGLNIGNFYFKRMFGNRGPSPSFYFEGATHWFGYDPYADNCNVGGFTHLVSLDYDTEKFTFLELPYASNQVSSFTSRSMFRLGESLAIFSICEVRTSIWVLKQNKGKRVWTRWFSGTSSHDRFSLSRYWIKPKTRVFYNEGDGGCLVGRNCSYNIASGQVRVLDKSMSPSADSQMYSESLVLCKGYGAQNLMLLMDDSEKTI